MINTHDNIMIIPNRITYSGTYYYVKCGSMHSIAYCGKILLDFSFHRKCRPWLKSQNFQMPPFNQVTSQRTNPMVFNMYMVCKTIFGLRITHVKVRSLIQSDPTIELFFIVM